MVVIAMNRLKSILERNIDAERQKLYKKQQYKYYRVEEARGVFQQEVFCIRRFFEEHNPLYSSFYLSVEVTEEDNFVVILSTTVEMQQEEVVETEYIYRGQTIRRHSENIDDDARFVTRMNAVWLIDHNKWAVLKSPNREVALFLDRDELLKFYLTKTVRDIARNLEDNSSHCTDLVPMQ